MEKEIFNKSSVRIPEKDWDSFKSWLDEPAKTIPEIQELTQQNLIFDDFLDELGILAECEAKAISQMMSDKN